MGRLRDFCSLFVYGVTWTARVDETFWSNTRKGAEFKRRFTGLGQTIPWNLGGVLNAFGNRFL